ncbi:MICAL-like protein 1 isoform X1 [Puntigrus tetrazona]|uniref:MICAL-like protein 1 isoform X1 n=1 Tax=Puntigrus tetrazona TaxID=1606681 RepID=UPI001C8AE529|nr:MICAL-like protein 1 isoform X1 [Puntigrus tetrazona]
MCSLKALQDWCRDVCEGYSHVQIRDMSSSFTDGLAFCAIIHKHRPDLLDFHSLSKQNVYENMRLAFDVAERELGIPALLDPDELVSVKEPDLLSIITYISQLYSLFRGNSHVSQKIPVNNESSNSKTREQTHTKFSSDVVRSSNKRVCNVCHTCVHLIQRVLVKGRLYHRSCFRCSRCRRSLLPISFTVDSEVGLLQCSYPCRPAPKHNQSTNQHSQSNTSETDGDRSETNRDRSETYGDRSETDGDMSETDTNRREMHGDRSEMDRDKSETVGDRSETYQDGSEMDRNNSETCGGKSEMYGDMSEAYRDRSEMGRNKSETCGDKSETYGDKLNEGHLSFSSETDIQEPPKPAPRKRAGPQEPPRPSPRSPDHRPDNG